MPSALLEGQGIAVFRRENGEAYAALDYGHHGGGHGHPDRLNLLLARGARRILDDMGTGSYVDRSLHWYRSTLAHNAPLVNGRSQSRASGTLMAYDERGDLGWICARARVSELPETIVERALTVTGHACIDELRWTATESVRVELPVHAGVRVETASAWSEARLDGGDGLEDGFSFVHDARRAAVQAGALVRLADERVGRDARVGQCQRRFGVVDGRRARCARRGRSAIRARSHERSNGAHSHGVGLVARAP